MHRTSWSFSSSSWQRKINSFINELAHNVVGSTAVVPLARHDRTVGQKQASSELAALSACVTYSLDCFLVDFCCSALPLRYKHNRHVFKVTSSFNRWYTDSEPLQALLLKRSFLFICFFFSFVGLAGSAACHRGLYRHPLERNIAQRPFIFCNLQQFNFRRNFISIAQERWNVLLDVFVPRSYVFGTVSHQVNHGGLLPSPQHSWGGWAAAPPPGRTSGNRKLMGHGWKSWVALTDLIFNKGRETDGSEGRVTGWQTH